MPINLTKRWPAALAAWAQNQSFPWVSRRVIAIDLGSSHLKVAVAAAAFGQLRLVHQRIVDLQAEGLLSLEEIDRHLQEIIKSLGNHPLALALPQHLSLSHLIDLPVAPEGEVAAMIERETRSLSGLSDGAIVYDYQRLEPFGRHAHPFWVTIAREQEVQTQIQRLAGPDNDHTFCEVTSAANALILAYLAGPPRGDKVLLADLGAGSTTVAALFRGQSALVSSLQIGSESFTNSIASLKNCSFDEAEHLKRTANLFHGPDHLPGFQAVVELWRQDVEKVLREWEDEHPDLRNPREPWTVLLSGGGSLQEGLLAYVRHRSSLVYEAWPEATEPGLDLPLNRQAITQGLLLQAGSRTPRAVSLLPRFLSRLKRRQEQLMALNVAGALLVFVLMFLMAVGFALKISATNRKDRQLVRARTALTMAAETERLIEEREQAFNRVRFLVHRQARTVDALSTLRILQRIREKRDLWFLLVADQESYALGAATRPAETNAFIGPEPAPDATNALETNPGYVVELCLPDKTAAPITVLREIVDGLKSEKLFRGVDTLPAIRRNTNHFDAKQLPADRYFSLELNLEEKEWQRRSFDIPRKPATNAAVKPPN